MTNPTHTLIDYRSMSSLQALQLSLSYHKALYGLLNLQGKPEPWLTLRKQAMKQVAEVQGVRLRTEDKHGRVLCNWTLWQSAEPHAQTMPPSIATGCRTCPLSQAGQTCVVQGSVQDNLTRSLSASRGVWRITEKTKLAVSGFIQALERIIDKQLHGG